MKVGTVKKKTNCHVVEWMCETREEKQCETPTRDPVTQHIYVTWTRSEDRKHQLTGSGVSSRDTHREKIGKGLRIFIMVINWDLQFIIHCSYKLVGMRNTDQKKKTLSVVRCKLNVYPTWIYFFFLTQKVLKLLLRCTNLNKKRNQKKNIT